MIVNPISCPVLWDECIITPLINNCAAGTFSSTLPSFTCSSVSFNSKTCWLLVHIRPYKCHLTGVCNTFFLLNFYWVFSKTITSVVLCLSILIHYILHLGGECVRTCTSQHDMTPNQRPGCTVYSLTGRSMPVIYNLYIWCIFHHSFCHHRYIFSSSSSRLSQEKRDRWWIIFVTVFVHKINTERMHISNQSLGENKCSLLLENLDQKGLIWGITTFLKIVGVADHVLIDTLLNLSFVNCLSPQPQPWSKAGNSPTVTELSNITLEGDL